MACAAVAGAPVLLGGYGHALAPAYAAPAYAAPAYAPAISHAYAAPAIAAPIVKAVASVSIRLDYHKKGALRYLNAGNHVKWRV